MTENIAQTVQQAIQDIVAPDVRELKGMVRDLQKQMAQRFDAVDRRFEAMNQRGEDQNAKTDAQFETLMHAIGEFKALSELSTLRVINALSERVAVIESRLDQRSNQ